MKLADRIVALLREQPLAAWKPRALAAALEVRPAEVTEAVSALRYAGKLEWNRIALRPSMLADVPEPLLAAPTTEEESVVATIAAIGEVLHAPVVLASAPPSVAIETVVVAPVLNPPPPRDPLAERRQQDQAEMGLRLAAVRSGAVAPASVAMVEEVTTMFAESAADAMLAVNRRWPGLWVRLIDSARAEGIRPGVRFAEVVEAGLAALEGGA